MGFYDEMVRKTSTQSLRDPMPRDEAYALLGALKDALLAANARITALEAHGVKYAGVWQRAQSYARGEVVSHKGSAWVALKAVPSGADPVAGAYWQLMVKCGRDGKDVR